jgi:hypothetical protein
MSLIDDKRDIFNSIAAYKSMETDLELPNPTDSISSINNTSKDPTEFLLDLLSTLKGSTGLVQTMGELMTTFIRGVEDDLKNELKKQAQTFNSDDIVPSGFSSTGYNIPLSGLDIFEKLKNDPDSDIGKLLYSDLSNNFDRSIYDTIVADGGIVNYKGIMNFTYNDATDSINVKPVNSSVKIGNFLENFIDSIDIINEIEFTANIINILYGTISSNENKTLQNIVFEEKLEKTIQKLINEDEDISISPQELRNIESIAREKKESISLIDVGCSSRVSNVTVDQIQKLVNSNTGNTNYYGVGINYIQLLDNSFNNDSVANKNRSTIRDSYIKRLINAILENLVRSTTFTPQIRLLFIIVDAFKGGGIEIRNPFDDIEKNRNLYDCIIKNAKQLIGEFLFNLAKKELLKLVVIISKQILKERYSGYIRIIRSFFRVLTGALDVIT